MFTINDVNYFDSLTEAKLAILNRIDSQPDFVELAEFVRVAIENHQPRDVFLQQFQRHPSYQQAKSHFADEIACLQRSHFDLTGVVDKNMNPLLGATESFLATELLLNPSAKMEEVTRKVSGVIADTLRAHANDPAGKYMEPLRSFATAVIFEHSQQYPGGLKLDTVNALIAAHNQDPNVSRIETINVNELRDPAFNLSDDQVNLIVSAVANDLQGNDFNLMQHMTYQEIYGFMAMKNMPFVFSDNLQQDVLQSMSQDADYQKIIKEFGYVPKLGVDSVQSLYQEIQKQNDDPDVRRFISDNMMYESDLYLCERNKGRGQPQQVMTNTFGIVRGDNPQLRQGLPTTPDYSWVDWTTCEFFKNSQIVGSMVQHETPFISSFSGSTSLMMNLMLSSFALPDASDRQAYMQSVIGYIVGVGFHSQHEIMGPIAHCLNLIPKDEYPIEVAIMDKSHPPQYNNVYKLLEKSDPDFAAKREAGWAKLMDWHKNVYTQHNQKSIDSLLARMIEHYPDAKDTATVEAFIVNILKHEKMQVEKGTLATFMKNGSSEILQNLFKTQDVKPSTEMLVSAIEGGNANAVDAMLKLNVDINKGKPLLSALSSGHKAIVTMLLEKGADLDVTDSIGMNPVHIVYADKDPEMLELLLKHGADIDSFDIGGNTMLHDQLVSDDPDMDMVNFLVTHGADLELRSGWGDDSSPLDLAIEGGHIEALGLLLSKLPAEDLETEKDALIEAAQDAGQEQAVVCLQSFFAGKKEDLSSTSVIRSQLGISGKALPTITPEEELQQGSGPVKEGQPKTPGQSASQDAKNDDLEIVRGPRSK